jgi:hypothetical protein
MQGTQFEALDQDDGARIRLAELGSHPQCRKGSVTSHEPQVVPLGAQGHPEVAHDVVIGAGVVEARTGDRDDVRYVPRPDPGAVVQDLPRQGNRKTPGLGGEDGVPGCGARTSQGPVGTCPEEAVGGIAVVIPDDRVPALDAGTSIDGSNETPFPLVPGPLLHLCARLFLGEGKIREKRIDPMDPCPHDHPSGAPVPAAALLLG